MRPFEEAQAEVLAAVQALPSEKVSIWDALGRVLAEDIYAPESVPPFENSAMDGFAVRGADVDQPGGRLEIVADLQAGDYPTVEIAPGEAVRIMTGAPLPPGADTIVKVEDTEVDGGHVTVHPAVATGTSVRPAGGDVKKGDLVFSTGTRLSPMHMGVLATLGMASLTVARRPTVAFMSTGDELTAVGEGALRPGMIWDSNRPMLAALLDGAGVEAFDLGIVPDDEAALEAALGKASRFDAIVTTGGVSMGDYDVTKLLLSKGGDVEFWKVAMQPAKPFAFGRLGDSVFFGLPGNPVSVMVSFEQFVRPALLKMMGSKAIFRPQTVGVADEELITDPEKTVFVRVRITRNVNGRLHVATSGGQASNVLSAAAGANALAVVPRGTARIAVGGDVMIEMIHSPESREENDV